MSIQVDTIEELKAAIDAGENDIITYDDDVVKKLKAVKLAKSWGPVAVAGIVAAIPLVTFSGPLGGAALYAVAPAAGVATSTIVTLIVAIGGVIAISLFSDWEYVELPGGIKLKRKRKK